MFPCLLHYLPSHLHMPTYPLTSTCPLTLSPPHAHLPSHLHMPTYPLTSTCPLTLSPPHAHLPFHLHMPTYPFTSTCPLTLSPPHAHLPSHLHMPILYRRMNYTDAIQYLNENDIKKEDGSPFVFGDVSIMHFCL